MSVQNENAIFTALAEEMGISVPEQEVEQEAETLLKGFLAAKKYESFSKGGYMELMRDVMSNREAYLEEFRAQARSELLEERVLREVIVRENISVSQEELEAEAVAIAARQGVSLDEVRAFFGKGLGLLERDVLKSKARELCLHRAGV